MHKAAIEDFPSGFSFIGAKSGRVKILSTGFLHLLLWKAVYSADERHDIHDLSMERFWKNKVQKLLRAGLSDRVKSIRAIENVSVE